jgi:hypothetical protein
LQSLGSEGVTKLLKVNAWKRRARFIGLDTPISRIIQPVDNLTPLAQFVFDNEQPWWTSSNSIDKANVCVYCEIATDPDHEDLEHIIPESIGCNKTLYAGAVCKKCNNTLGKVDNAVFKEPIFASGQIGADVFGKDQRERKSLNKFVSKSDQGVKIGGTSGDQAISGKPNEYVVSRYIAKCAVNIFLNTYGSGTVRRELFDLVEYVRAPKTREDIWPFVAVYTPVGYVKSVHFSVEGLKNNGRDHLFAVFICASGLFATGAHRYISGVSDLMLDHLQKKLDNISEETGKKPGPVMTYSSS